MKTQIIQIESFDDYISIRDKMNWSKTPRVLLVFPKRRRVRLARLDLILLQRHALGLGAQVGLVTNSLRIRRTATKLSIPVFGSSLEAQRSVWPAQRASARARRRAPRQDLRAAREALPPVVNRYSAHPVMRILVFALGVAAVLAVALAFVPRANVQVALLPRAQSITIPVRANLGVNDVFLSGSVPAKTVSVILDGERSLPASGQMDVPAQAASGEALFRNLTDLATLVPAGTIISTADAEPVRFRTLEDGVVDGGVGATVSVPVRALEFGARSNLDPNRIQAIEGELSLWLAVSNPDALIGGADATVAAPTDTDREELRDALLFEFHRNAAEEIRAALQPDALIFPETLTPANILDESFDPPAGQPADTLTLSMRVEFTAQYAAAEDLRELAQSALAAALPSGMIPVPGSLTFEPLGAPETSALGATAWQMRVSQTLRPDLSDAQIAWLAQGRSPEAALRRLEENLDLAAPPRVAVFPTWWPWLPVAPFRIDVTVR